jgi:hypothetical protein
MGIKGPGSVTVLQVGSGASLRDEPRTPDPGSVRGCAQGRGGVVGQDGSAGILRKGEQYSAASPSDLILRGSRWPRATHREPLDPRSPARSPGARWSCRRVGVGGHYPGEFVSTDLVLAKIQRNVDIQRAVRGAELRRRLPARKVE